MSHPLLSIVTACRDSAGTIEGTLRSVVRERTDACEYIVVDGGSTDGTVDIVSRYEHGIDVLVSEPDRGISHAFNKGIELAAGEYVFIVSADDWLLEGSLAKIRSCLGEHHPVDVLFGDVLVPNGHHGMMRIKPDASLASVESGSPLKHGGCIVRRAAYKRFGGYDERYRLAMDYELIYRFLSAGARFVYVPEVFTVVSEGGINQRRRHATRMESYDIAVRYGVPRRRAAFFLLQKMLRDALRTAAAKTGLLPWIRRYRWRS